MCRIFKRLYNNRKLFLYLLLSVTWTLFIFSFSLQTGEESSQVSGGIVATFIDMFFGEGFLFAEELEFFIRKLAHFSEYFVLGVLVWLTVMEIKFVSDGTSRHVRDLLVAVFICALVASCDEMIQLFSAGRSGQVTDVLLDSVGALCGSVSARFMGRFLRK